MRKIWLVAQREYLAMVYTKGFVVGMLLAPLIFMGGLFVPRLLMNRVNLRDKQMIVLDGTKELFDILVQSAEARNTNEIFDPDTNKQSKPKYVLEQGPNQEPTDVLRLELSNRIRRGEITAFVEVPPGTLGTNVAGPEIRFYAENAALSEEFRWFQQTINQAVRRRRLQTAGLDPAVVQKAISPVAMEGYRLTEQTASGEIKTGSPVDRLTSVLTPVVIMMLMFMIIFMAVQPALECVFEEKQNRISELLLGSINTTQLMAGKLIGVVSGSLTTMAVYILSGLALVAFNDNLDAVPLRILPWFIVFQLLAVIMYTALFMSVGAAMGSAQEAQGIMIVMWLPLMIGFFAWLNIAREPNGPMATTLSFFPPCTPMIMVLRLTVSDSVPLGQTLAAVLMLIAFTAACIFAAGRIFRIGVLAQGKAPTPGQLLTWVFRG